MVEVTFWGTRGSIAKAGPTTLRYGGNTSCVQVRSDAGTLVVIDCGTGAHGLGHHLVAEAAGRPVDGHILVSHTHWDHIQGLPFFAPLFEDGGDWHIWGPSGLGGSLSEILAGQMEYTYFPVSIDQLAASVTHHDLVEGLFEIGDISVETRFLNHPALTLGYRLEVDGAVVVYSSDHEPHDRELAAGGDVGRNRHDAAHARWIEGADLLIHDAQYGAAEFARHVGWGHSTVEYVVEVAQRAGVGTVALFHHDPNRTDDQVDGLLDAARAHAAACGYAGEIIGAAEGRSLTVRGAAGSPSVTGARSRSALAPAVAADTVVVFARDREIAAVVDGAAAGEGLRVVAVADLGDAFDEVIRHRPGVVLAEAVDDDGGFDLVAAIRDLDDPELNSTPVIMIGPATARWRPDAAETRITEWLDWPASAFLVRTKLRAWLLRRATGFGGVPIPVTETDRLAALHRLGVLDSPPEERFDRYTAEISALLDVPIALVSFVDTDRQWFKSSIGVSVTETPRDVSLCAHAILREGLLEVPDALVDPRFSENPLVVGEPRIRFYAGMPLTLRDGSRVGTLCVADSRPRRLDAASADHLRRVARLVVDELEGP